MEGPPPGGGRAEGLAGGRGLAVDAPSREKWEKGSPEGAEGAFDANEAREDARRQTREEISAGKDEKPPGASGSREGCLAQEAKTVAVDTVL